ncbi:MAG: efflux RND transporter permease subunit, partial [Acidobacteria bacterium]|nr:efflux RND transporter permease subunit [Acidobacteriota bacterium]
ITSIFIAREYRGRTWAVDLWIDPDHNWRRIVEAGCGDRVCPLRAEAHITVAVLMFGLVAFGRLPVNLLPDISYPTLTVETKYSQAAPNEVENLVTKPIEEAVAVVSGVQRITSRSRAGVSEVTMEFGWGTNMDFASLDVREKIDLVQLPRDTEKPNVLRFDPSNDPILRVILSGGSNLVELRQFADKTVKKDLESLDGIAAAKINGGLEEEIHVHLDETKLAQLGLTVDDVNRTLSRNNINIAGGSLYENEARYLVRTVNEFQTVGELNDLVIREDGGRRILMKDVAAVERGTKDRVIGICSSDPMPKLLPAWQERASFAPPGTAPPSPGDGGAGPGGEIFGELSLEHVLKVGFPAGVVKAGRGKREVLRWGAGGGGSEAVGVG